MEALEVSWPFLFLGVLLILSALKIKNNAKKKKSLIIQARVLNAATRFEPGVYKSRAFAYDLTIEYSLDGSLVQKTIPSMEHFPENSVIEIIPMNNRIEIVTRTPCGPLTNLRFDIILFSIAMFILVSGVELALAECNASPVIMAFCSSMPLICIASVFSWYSLQKKKEINNFNNSIKTKVNATVIEHRLERKTDKTDKMHNILSYKYNQLSYLFDYVTPPSIALAMNASFTFDIDPKTGFVINPKKNETQLKILSLIAKAFWLFAILNVVLSLI